jgi:hypothetical protein
MSLTGLADAYNAAWLRGKMKPGGKTPRAAFIQEMVQAWKELRKGGEGVRRRQDRRRHQGKHKAGKRNFAFLLPDH